MISSVRVTYSNSVPPGSIRMTSTQLKSIGFIPNTNIMLLKVGSIETGIEKIVIDDSAEADELSFSEDLRYQIHIPENSSLQLKTSGKGHFELGPLIGVFISSKKVVGIFNDKWDSVYQEFNLACKALKGLCCFFSMCDIDWENKLVKALLLTGTKWMASIVPIPTVIYDRCFGENSREICLMLRRKLGSSCHVVNSMPKLGKWETYITLNKSMELETLMSPTTQYHSFEDVADALNKYTSVYLKPDMLYKGKGIFRISKAPENGYKIEYRGENENKVEYMADLTKLESVLLKDYMKAGGNYLIQAAIDKATYKGYPFDFRFLYQKNWKGEWEPGGISVRMGAPGSIITSPRSGGAVEELPTVLKEEFGEEPGTKNGLYENIVRIGKQVVLCLEKEFGDCVELGLDMTIDTNLRIWVIEVNGKPLKVSLKWLDIPEMLIRCYRRPIEYCTCLTGFKSADTGWGGI